MNRDGSHGYLEKSGSVKNVRWSKELLRSNPHNVEVRDGSCFLHLFGGRTRCLLQAFSTPTAAASTIFREYAKVLFGPKHLNRSNERYKVTFGPNYLNRSNKVQGTICGTNSG